MQTIEYKTTDKSSWPRGPWDDEPDKRQWMDERTGLPCLIVRGPSGALCGYVGVSDGHPAFGKDYDVVPVKVHRGLSISCTCWEGIECESICHAVDDGEDDTVWWLGFDCAGASDLRPKCARDTGGDDTQVVYRDIEFVSSEVRALAAQLNVMR